MRADVSCPDVASTDLHTLCLFSNQRSIPSLLVVCQSGSAVSRYRTLQKEPEMIRLSLAKRICYHYPYVMLAATLSDDPVDEEDTSSLRADADNEGICYIHVISSLGDGWYLVRVAARPEFLPKGYIMILSEGQLAYMLPWDCRLRGGHMTPDCIYKRLCAYRASHQPTRQRVTPAPGQPS